MATKLGQLLTDASLLGKRDCYHVPGIWVTSRQSLHAGQKVKFVGNDTTRVVTTNEPWYAIVDPFLQEATLDHERSVFLVFLNQEYVDGFHHAFRIKGIDSAVVEKPPIRITDLVAPETGNFAAPAPVGEIVIPKAIFDDNDADVDEYELSNDYICPGCADD